MPPQLSPSAPWQTDELGLLRSVIDLTSRLSLNEVLGRFVEIATGLVGAGGAAVSVLDSRGLSETFLTHFADPAAAKAAASLENSHSVLTLMRPDEPVVLNDVQAPGANSVFGNAHPAITCLLGVPVRVRSMVFAHLYLVNKPGGFTQADGALIMTLATAGGVAIENAQLYESARRRVRWLTAGQEITTAMLSGADEEEALALIAARAREVARADTCVLVLPSLEDRLVIEIADGVSAEDLIGTAMPRDGRSHTVLAEGIGMIVDSFSHAFTLRVAALRRFGSALYAPMRTGARSIGVILLLREDGRRYFDQADLATAESFASQAAVVLVLAEARHADDVKSLLEERERIARDLHDLAIQQLFATGMRLESARVKVADGQAGSRHDLEAILAQSIDNVDDSVRQIRSIIHDLRDPDTDAGLVERLRREASLARAGLGFAPSLVIVVNDQVIDAPASAENLDEEVDKLIDSGLADDVVAVAREGLANAARHAKSSSVQVTVSVQGGTAPAARPSGWISVEVTDDGQGLGEGHAGSSGLANLAARAKRHGGSLDIATRQDARGTRLLWRVPVS
jgi:signal transduction histidine kinase